jgi:transposase-like protein
VEWPRGDPALSAAIKPIYPAASAERAEVELAAFEAGPWGQKFPTVAAAWRRARDRVILTKNGSCRYVRCIKRGPARASSQLNPVT